MEFTDHLDRKITLKEFPKRIISLVPSQTELLFDLGLEDEIVGVTRYCVHPVEKVKQKEKIGGTKQVDIEKVKQLQPDLIIGNLEENTKKDIELLEKEFPVWISDVRTYRDSLRLFSDFGNILNKAKRAEELKAKVMSGFHELKKIERKKKKVFYFIWRKPYMVAGTDTFINDMLLKCGMENMAGVLKNGEDRYPVLEPEEIKPLNPDMVLISTEPYAFREKHIKEFRQFAPEAEVKLVDGEMFCWFGSRLLKAADYFASILDSSFVRKSE